MGGVDGRIGWRMVTRGDGLVIDLIDREKEGLVIGSGFGLGLGSGLG
jgi:hypothetical protein